MTWVPQACTLPTAEQPLRVAEFDELFRRALVGVVRSGDGKAVLTLQGGPSALEVVADLTARETACCSFFSFSIAVVGADRLTVAIEVPPGQAGVLDALVARAEAALSGR